MLSLHHFLILQPIVFQCVHMFTICFYIFYILRRHTFPLFLMSLYHTAFNNSTFFEHFCMFVYAYVLCMRIMYMFYVLLFCMSIIYVFYVSVSCSSNVYLYSIVYISTIREYYLYILYRYSIYENIVF